jgi:hypothetical protein
MVVIRIINISKNKKPPLRLRNGGKVDKTNK